jgi:hypothetical protein
MSARLFSVPQVENEVKKGLHFADVAEIQEAVTDKDSPKRGIFGIFSETVRLCTKRVYMPMELILNFKKVSSSCAFDFFKKSVLKLLDCIVYYAC